MANLKDVIYLSAEDYNTLYTNGTVTINGTTLTYDANNVYIVPDDTDAKISTALANYIAKSSTAGLVKNDGTIDTNTYITSAALANYIQTSNTSGLVKNDGTIDTNTYLTSIPSTYIQTSSTSGLIKNDGSIDTSTYATTSQLPSTMGASGSGHAGGLVPDTPSTSGTTKYLREDGTWQTPPGGTYVASDFDIKDLSDSTSLRTAWSGKQDAIDLTFTKNSTGFSIAGGTTSKTLTVSSSYTLGAACAKGVTDNSSSAAVTSSDTNLITGRTLHYHCTNKGFLTSIPAASSSSYGGIKISASGSTLTITV